MDRLAELKAHNEHMYAHSLRVGLYCYGLAMHEGWPQVGFPLFSGCGHDMGKCLISNDLLNCTTKLTEEDFAVIHDHPRFGYEMLKDDFPMTAVVAGLHHKFGPKHYGVDVANCIPSWCGEQHIHNIIQNTFLVMICDFFDAVTTRRNTSSLVADNRDMVAVYEVMRSNFPFNPDRCKWLCENLLEYSI